MITFDKKIIEHTAVGFINNCKGEEAVIDLIKNFIIPTQGEGDRDFYEQVLKYILE